MRQYSFLLIFFSLGLSTWAQTADDALRLSSSNLSGTSRYVSMGGAFGALGGDLSAISDNPAAVSTFVYSEFNSSIALYKKNKRADIYDYSWSQGKSNFNFNNMGIVFSMPNFDPSSKWRSFNYGFNFNRQNNYHGHLYSKSINPYNSISDFFAEKSDGMTVSKIDGQKGSTPYNAYNTYLIDLVSGKDNSYESAFKSYGEEQLHEIKTTGARYDFSFSGGANYDDKLYLGMSFNSYSERFDYRSSFIEKSNNINDSIKEFVYTDKYTTKGNSFLAKFGFIYKPTDWVRIGGSFHTPSIFYLSDTYSNSISSVKGKNNENYYQESGEGHFDYEVTTPLKAMAALAFVIDRRLIVAFEYQYSDPSKTNIKANGLQSAFDDVNTDISNLFKATHNIKAGLEYRMSNISLRTGVAYFDSPFKDSKNQNNIRMNYTAGLGFNYNVFYLDLAYAYSKEDYQLYPYQLSKKPVDAYNVKEQTHKIMMTIGFRF